jgi:hypothetical protein
MKGILFLLIPLTCFSQMFAGGSEKYLPAEEKIHLVCLGKNDYEAITLKVHTSTDNPMKQHFIYLSFKLKEAGEKKLLTHRTQLNVFWDSYNTISDTITRFNQGKYKKYFYRLTMNPRTS